MRIQEGGKNLRLCDLSKGIEPIGTSSCKLANACKTGNHIKTLKAKETGDHYKIWARGLWLEAKEGPWGGWSRGLEGDHEGI